MTEQDFIPKAYSNTIEKGQVTWESPRNIALIKYWGKREHQIPENPSISFTLNNCKTITTLSFFKREISKRELHQILAKGFNLPKENIHSEYGMTELLSQAYSLGDEWFQCVPWMQVSIRNPENPMQEVVKGEEGLIGVIDLANISSCSFILTGDKGIMNKDKQFQVLGRWNPENLRGCNFLIDQD